MTAARSVNRLMLVIVDVLAGWFEVWGLRFKSALKAQKWFAGSLSPSIFAARLEHSRHLCRGVACSL